MALYAYPNSDIENPGGWTVEPLWEKIDEEPFDDVDFLISPKSSAEDSFTIGLSGVPDPGVHTDHVVRIRAKTGVSGTLKYELMQGAVVIKDSGDVVLSTIFAEYNMTLSEGEAGNISDYGALRVRVTTVATQKNQRQNISWIRFGIPGGSQEVLLDGISGAASSLSGEVKRVRKIAGIINAVASVVGNLTVGGQILLNGISSAISSVAGEFKVTRKIDATASATSSVLADLILAYSLKGTASVQSALSGKLTIVGEATGVCQGMRGDGYFLNL